ncbi:hypothetical protein BVY01_00870 [bacterium I07]|nr:hypothetical protein BVY01_00870 [bacterium I07]
MSKIKPKLWMIFLILPIVVGFMKNKPDIPKGVDKEFWISVTKNVGFVITENGLGNLLKDVSDPKIKVDDDSSLFNSEKYRVKGFFVVKRNNIWVRVDLEPNTVHMEFVK